jgi:HlyD family secretion protein
MDTVKNRKDDSDVRMDWCSIHSPIGGTVLSRYHEPGEWVTPGTKLLTLANIRDIWAFIYVPQPEVAKLKPGMILKGYLPELGNREFDGKILKINDEAEFTPKNVQTQAERTRLVFGVKVSFLDSNAEEILKPGMTIEIQLPQD